MQVTMALALSIMSTATAKAEPEHQLWVALVDTTELSAESLHVLESEVASIYRRGGVRIRWVATIEPRPHAARVYLMDTLPSSLESRIRPFRGTPMGLALGGSGEVSGSTIYVARSPVASRLTGSDAAVPDPAALGRALGRIVAHELAHRFIQRRHTRHGILRATLGRSDLEGSSDEFSFTPLECALLREVALQVHGAAAPAPRNEGGSHRESKPR